MTSFKEGDVLLQPYPFTEQTGSKQRPAVVISSLDYNQTHPDIILAPITSQITALANQVALTEWRAAGLVKPSVVKPILSSFDARLIRRQLGELSASDRAQVRTLFAQILDYHSMNILTIVGAGPQFISSHQSRTCQQSAARGGTYGVSDPHGTAL